MNLIYIFVLSVSALVFAFFGTWIAYRWLSLAAVLDVPGERSNHDRPTPRGGGIAVIGSAAAFLLVGGAHGDVVLGALALAVLSFVEDRRGVPVAARLALQCVVVATALDALHAPVFQGVLPLALDKFATAALWVGFTNIYNFMDGIDEITVAETVALTLGITAITVAVQTLPVGVAADALVVAAAALGFWPWNRHKAKLFLGDVGSIPLGFLMGFMLLSLAAHGYWQAALILPAYYLTDATLTLLKRLLAGEKIWQAHSKHAYQRAVRGGRRHDSVVYMITLLNLGLVSLAVFSTLGGAIGWACLAIAYALALLLMGYFSATPQRYEDMSDAASTY